MITRISIDGNLIKDEILFKGSSVKSHIGNERIYTSESQLCNVTTLPREEWKHTTPDGLTSGAKLRTIDIRGDKGELEIITRHNEEGFKIGSMMNPQAELVYAGETLIGIIISDK